MTCTAVEVAGAEGDLSGTYIQSGYYYNRRGGYTSYMPGEDSYDQWLPGQGFSLNDVEDNYPYYYVSTPPLEHNTVCQ